MTSTREQLIEWVARLGGQLPATQIQSLAEAIERSMGQSWSIAHQNILATVPQPHLRAQVEVFLSLWQDADPRLTPAEVGIILRVAGATTRQVRQEQRVELVWTGPST